MSKPRSRTRPTAKDARKRVTPPDSRARANASPVRDALDAICASIEGGMPMTSAAWACGVSPQALDSRIRDDPTVLARVEQARSRSEAAHVAQLDACIAEGKPTAGICWKIERLFRRSWHIPTLVQSESRLEVTSVPASSEALRRAAEERARVEALEKEAGER